MKKFISITIVLFSIIYLYGCQNFYEPMQILSHAEYIVLEWVPPSINEKSEFLNVESYMLYYRKVYNGGWVFLGEAPPAKILNYTVYHSDLGDGLFEFAVRAVYSNTLKSSLHTSSDQYADPLGGWFLLWIRSR